MRNTCIIIILLLSSVILTAYPDDYNMPTGVFDVSGSLGSECLRLTVSTDIPTIQMPMLMQGLRLDISSDINEAPADSVSIMFPSAHIVRDKVRRHPDEVKPTFSRGDSTMVRPDLQPLISALCDTTLTIVSQDSTWRSKQYMITLDRTTGILTFDADVPMSCINVDTDSVAVNVVVMDDTRRKNPEFTGRRLSKEQRQRQNSTETEKLDGNEIQHKFSRQMLVKINKDGK